MTPGAVASRGLNGVIRLPFATLSPLNASGSGSDSGEVASWMT